MKKRMLITVMVVVTVFVLVIPIPFDTYKDGGTVSYTSLTYKIVDWNRITDGGVYAQREVYLFPNNFRSIDSLWEDELPKVQKQFGADPQDITDSTEVSDPSKQPKTNTLGYTQGEHREEPYEGSWINPVAAQLYEEKASTHLQIRAIYADCFFATPITPLPTQYKINGTLGEEWCVGDQVYCSYTNAYYDTDTQRMEADLDSIEASDFILEPGAAYKPVIYLYPEDNREVRVSLDIDGRLTCTYPVYRDGWTVTASPDGTLTDEEGQSYNYLYWEAELDTTYDVSEGTCVKGEDTAAFLEQALEELGLTRREANEFIVYWLPEMEQNPYNVISFQTDRYTEAAQLTVDPSPDTMIRVFMVWYATNDKVEIAPQTLMAPVRDGFTVVEWGGTELQQ